MVESRSFPLFRSMEIEENYTGHTVVGSDFRNSRFPEIIGSIKRCSIAMGITWNLIKIVKTDGDSMGTEANTRLYGD